MKITCDSNPESFAFVMQDEREKKNSYTKCLQNLLRRVVIGLAELVFEDCCCENYRKHQITIFIGIHLSTAWFALFPVLFWLRFRLLFSDSLILSKKKGAERAHFFCAVVSFVFVRACHIRIFNSSSPRCFIFTSGLA